MYAVIVKKFKIFGIESDARNDFRISGTDIAFYKVVIAGIIVWLNHVLLCYSIAS